MSLLRVPVRLIATLVLAGSFLALAWLSPLGGGLAWAAQPVTGPLRLIVHRVEGPEEVTTEIVPGLRLRVRFSVFDDEKGQPVATKQDGGGDSGQPVQMIVDEVTYERSATPVSEATTVVMLVDNSATFAPFSQTKNYELIREKTAEALKSFGAKYVSVFAFNNTESRLTPYTLSVEEAATALKKLRPVSNSRACLLQATNNVVNDLDLWDGTSRKILVIVTGSSDTCGGVEINALAQSARDRGIEVYAVGIKGYSASDTELEAIVAPTGGVVESKTVEIGQLNISFDRVVGVVKNQWQADFVIYPLQGEKTPELVVPFGTLDVARGPLPAPITVPRDYPPPPRVSIPVQPEVTARQLKADLLFENATLIAALQVDIIDKGTLRTVFSQVITDTVSDQVLIQWPDGALETGRTYELRITALSVDGVPFPNGQGVVEFNFDPAPPTVDAFILSGPTLEDPTIGLTVTVRNVFDLGGLQLMLRNDKIQPPQVITTTQAAPEGPFVLTVPYDTLPTGEYSVIVVAVDSAGEPLTFSAPQPITLTAPSAVARLTFWLQKNPLVTVGVGLLGCLAVVGLMVLAIGGMLARRRAQIRTVDMALPERAQVQAAMTESLVSNKPVGPARPPASRKPPSGAGSGSAPQRQAPRAEADPGAAQHTMISRVMKSKRPVLELTIAEPATLTFRAEVTKSPFTLGRKAGCDAVLPVEATSGVSGQHLSLVFVQDQWMVLDEGSTYGSLIDGVVVTKGQPVPLKDGVLLGLGPRVKVKVRFKSS
ncbi:MAG: FHA domain-containing protein [Anaerolineales bacterium]|nr:FHA domain-containing protein [Anaerolineales bacterium]